MSTYVPRLFLKDKLVKYICVMDADDIAMPYRIKTQVILMESHHNILALVSDFKLFNGCLYQRPRSYPVLKVFMLHNNMFLHPSLIIRRSALEKVSFMMKNIAIHLIMI
jgi:hypothetical protein